MLAKYTRGMIRPGLRRDLLMIGGLAAVYFIAGKFGIYFATALGSVSLVWPPTGLSLVALQLFGFRLWPGILAGAFMISVLNPEVTPLSAACIAVANTLEAVIGSCLLRRSGFNNALDRMEDVVRLLILAAVLSTTVSATSSRRASSQPTGSARSGPSGGWGT
jgi:integral membrane sensor domain MASE1